MKTEPQKPAREKIMDYLAVRSYSELEIQQKMADAYSPSEIQDALRFAKKMRLMQPPEELASRIVDKLKRKNKGTAYINEFLKEKGLPTVTEDSESDFERAKDALRAKFASKLNASPLESNAGIDYEELMTKASRHLAQRGFDEEIIERVLAWAAENQQF